MQAPAPTREVEGRGKGSGAAWASPFPPPRGIPVHTRPAPISRGCIWSQATLLPGYSSLKTPDISGQMACPYRSGPADTAPCQRSPVGMAGC